MSLVNKPKNLIAVGAALAGVAVILGAFGAHALKDQLEPRMLEIYHTGVTYHFYHALALIMLGLSAHACPRLSTTLIAILLLLGIFLFSGSLYALSLSGITKFGAITPLGGLCFIVAWMAFAVKMVKQN